jgi:hypothetical protein
MPKRQAQIKCGLQCLGAVGKRKVIMKNAKKKGVLKNITNVPARSIDKKHIGTKLSLQHTVQESIINTVKSTLHTKGQTAHCLVESNITSKKSAKALFADILSTSTINDDAEVITIDSREAIAKFIGVSFEFDRRVHPVQFGRGLSCSDGTTSIYAWAEIIKIVATISPKVLRLSISSVVTACEARPLLP